jgi:hypothetical protein
MALSFKSAYGNFLDHVGIPISCISYYVGTVDYEGTEQLQGLYHSIIQRSSRKSIPDKVFTSTNGQDLAKALGMISTKTYDSVAYEMARSGQVPTDKELCNKIFWERKQTFF